MVQGNGNNPEGTEKLPVPGSGVPSTQEPAGDNSGTLPGRPNAGFTTAVDQLTFLKELLSMPLERGLSLQQQQHKHPHPHPEPTSAAAGHGLGAAPGCSGKRRDALE